MADMGAFDTVEDFAKQFNTLYVLRDLPDTWAGQQINSSWANPVRASYM